MMALWVYGDGKGRILNPQRKSTPETCYDLGGLHSPSGEASLGAPHPYGCFPARWYAPLMEGALR